MLDHAPEDIRRMAFLGRATGQRASDLVRLGPANRVHDGVSFTIGKLRDKEHFVPLTQAEIAEIDSWEVAAIPRLWIRSPRKPVLYRQPS